MKNTLKKILRLLIPLVLSILLIWWLFKKVDFHDVMRIIRNEVDYWWLLVVMAIVTLSHCIRGIRWGYQLRAAGVGNVPDMALCCSIFGAYSLNLLVPYMGEAWRIIYMAHRQKVPVSTVLGTDIGDRISDAIVVVILFIVALVVGHPYIVSFLNHYAVGEKVMETVSNPWLWSSIILFIGLSVALIYIFRKREVMQSLMVSLKKIWQGFVVLFTMKGRLAYLWLTLGIWLCYYLETYIGFMAFPFTRELMSRSDLAYGLLPGLISFVLSSMSIAIPSNGGLGPWNLAVMFALSLFGIKDADGAAFSIVLWSAESLMLVILGIFTLIYVSLSRHHNISPLPDKTPL